ncbi:MAG: hypothetical protein ACYCYP_06035 [Leptospirales bacterium]
MEAAFPQRGVLLFMGGLGGKNWRLIFGFKEENAADVDYENYH